MTDEGKIVQKENSTCIEGSVANVAVPLSLALRDAEEWNGKHQRACLIIAEIEAVSDNCINAEKFTAADAMADLQEIRNIIKRGKEVA